jgi:hypothetical protein
VALSPSDVRRWFAGFEAAEEADREALRQQGPRPQESAALFLSLLEAARTTAGGRLPIDQRRAEREEAVRAAWDRLRSRLTP